MFTKLKAHGASSTAGSGAGKRGFKGRLDLTAAVNEDGSYSLRFTDYGNFGKVRWEGDFGTLSKEDLEDMSDALLDLANNRINTTAADPAVVDAAINAVVEAEAARNAPAPVEAAEAEAVAEAAEDYEAAQDETADETAQVVEGDADDMDQLTA